MARHWSSGPWQLPTGTFASVSSPSSESSAAFKNSCYQEPRRSRKGCSEGLGSARDAKLPNSASTSPLASIKFIPPSPQQVGWVIQITAGQTLLMSRHRETGRSDCQRILHSSPHATDKIRYLIMCSYVTRVTLTYLSLMPTLLSPS